MLHPDPRLPFLDMAWSRGKMVTFFNERVLPATSHGREVTGVKIERMRYKPGKEYQALSPGSELADRARLCQGLGLIRTVVRKLARSPHSLIRRGPDWPPLLLLDEAAACLAEL